MITKKSDTNSSNNIEDYRIIVIHMVRCHFCGLEFAEFSKLREHLKECEKAIETKQKVMKLLEEELSLKKKII